MFGSSVHLNSSGTILAVGSAQYSSNSGRTQIYEWNGSAWAIKGSHIAGMAASDSSRVKSMNNDGTIVAIGATGFDGGVGTDSGTVLIYEWSGSAWQLKGSQINGLTVGEKSGGSVSLNSDGTIVAIGAPYFDGGAGTDSGTTRIY